MPGEFSISESPISDAAALGAATGPSFTFSSEDVKYRYGERYASESSNRKFLGIPLGVYLGFTPSFANNILTLTTNGDFGYSFARLASQDDQFYIVDVVMQTTATLDFTNHSAFPVNVVLKVNGALGVAHSAQILTQAAAPSFPTEILLGVVTAPNTISVSEPFDRDTPYAYSGAPLGYGFMKEGAVEELLAAIALNAEVAAARTDLDGFGHPDLNARIEADGASAAMAGRLGKEMKTILAGDFPIAAPTDTINISRAFARIYRTAYVTTPYQDFDGFASEERVGAVTAGVVPEPPPSGALTDAERNVCAIVDSTTQARLLDSTRQVAYGRLVHDEIILSGTDIAFIGGTAVTGTATLFTTQTQVGDLIQDPISGDFFEIGSITSDVALDISVPFPNPPTPPATPPGLRRRFTLNARTRAGVDSDAIFTMPVGTVRVYFNAWCSVEVPQYDYMSDLFLNFEESPVVVATTATAGKALITATLSEGKAGAIFAVQQIGTQIGAPHVHSIDFDGVATGAPSTADVSQRGPVGVTGDPGSGGTPGPTGPQGPQGVGFSHFDSANLFRKSGEYNHGTLGSGTQYSFTTAMSGSEILFLTGGNCEWFSPVVFDGDDHWQIDDIRIDPPGSMNVRLDARVPTGGSPVAKVKFFLNAATK